MICDVIRWVKEVARRSVQMDYGGEEVRENVLSTKKKSVTSSTAVHPRAFNLLVRPRTYNGKAYFFIKGGSVIVPTVEFNES